MNDFLKDVIKETGNEYAGIVSDARRYMEM